MNQHGLNYMREIRGRMKGRTRPTFTEKEIAERIKELDPLIELYRLSNYQIKRDFAVATLKEDWLNS